MLNSAVLPDLTLSDLEGLKQYQTTFNIDSQLKFHLFDSSCGLLNCPIMCHITATIFDLAYKVK